MRCVYVVLLVALSGCPKKELKPRNPQPPSTSETGVTTQVLRAGYDDGDAAKKGDKISIHFTGSLTDGVVPLASRSRCFWRIFTRSRSST